MNQPMMRAALAGGPQALNPVSPRAVSFFHSTPVLERRRRTCSNPGMGSFSSKRFNNYTKRIRRMESKRALLRNISEYAEYLFQSWRADDDRDNFSSVGGPSWFRRQFWSRGTKQNGFSSHESHWGSYRHKRKGGFDFCSSDDDDEAETIFRSSFGGEWGYYGSFGSFENFQWRYSSGHANHRRSWNWRYRTDDETESAPQSDLASERLALGLSASGPLKLEEVKSAYRSCALRWHPDRHQGSSKAPLYCWKKDWMMMLIFPSFTGRQSHDAHLYPAVFYKRRASQCTRLHCGV